MTTPRPVSDIESLLEHREWVERLARSLLGDSHRAQDVVQDTWIAAMEAPPASRGHEAGWLARVVKNLASKARRADQRRRRREETSSRHEATGSTIDAVARIEMERTLAEAVLALPPNFRDVVVRRFFRAMPPTEIAREMNIPAATARTRLKRALDRLRSDLDHRHGGRGAWTAAFAAALPGIESSGLGGGGSAASVLLGGIVVSKVKVVSLALLVFAFLCVLGSVRTAPTDPESVAEDVSAHAVLDGSRFPIGERPNRPSEDRDSVVDPVPDDSKARALAETGSASKIASVDPEPAPFFGRVVDDDTDTPIEGAVVLPYRSHGDPMNALVETTEFAEDERATWIVRTDAWGLFRIHENDTYFTWQIRSPGYGSHVFRVPGASFSEVEHPREFRMRPSASLRVEVVDPRGMGVPEAVVRLEATAYEITPFLMGGPVFANNGVKWEATTDFGGACVFRDLPTRVPLWATVVHGDRSHKILPDLSLAPRESLDVRWRIGGGGSIAGRVVDLRGQPHASVAIDIVHRDRDSDHPYHPKEDEERSTFVTLDTDGDGEFRVDDVPVGTWWIGPSTTRSGRSSSRGFTKVRYPLRVESDTETQVDILAVRDLSVRGRVAGIEEGERAWVSATTEVFDGVLSASVDADGSFELGGVLPGTYELKAHSFSRSSVSEVVMASAGEFGVLLELTGEVAVAERTEQGSGVLRVRVSGASQEPPSSLIVHQCDPDGRVSRTRLGEGGLHETTVPSGIYHVAIVGQRLVGYTDGIFVPVGGAGEAMVHLRTGARARVIDDCGPGLRNITFKSGEITVGLGQIRRGGFLDAIVPPGPVRVIAQESGCADDERTVIATLDHRVEVVFD